MENAFLCTTAACSCLGQLHLQAFPYPSPLPVVLAKRGVRAVCPSPVSVRREPGSEELQQSWTMKSSLGRRWERVAAEETVESQGREPRRTTWKGWKANRRYRAGWQSYKGTTGKCKLSRALSASTRKDQIKQLQQSCVLWAFRQHF